MVLFVKIGTGCMDACMGLREVMHVKEAWEAQRLNQKIPGATFAATILSLRYSSTIQNRPRAKKTVMDCMIQAGRLFP
jgi:hypothetical protein